MRIKLPVKFRLLLIVLTLFSCNRENIWKYSIDDIVDPENQTAVVTDVKITSITTTDSGVQLHWEYPEDVEIRGVDVSWKSGSDSDTLFTADTGCTLTLPSYDNYTFKLVTSDVDGNTSPGATFDVTFSGASTYVPKFIYTAEDLNAVRGGVYTDWTLTDTYYLMANIDLSDSVYNDPWTPIGDSSSNAFDGKFIGNDHTISNLKNTAGSTSYLGLFGYISSTSPGKVSNLTLNNVTMTGDTVIGAVAAYNEGEISNCAVTGTGKITANYYVAGGFVGTNNQGIIDYSYSTLDVKAGNQQAGGLCGANNSSITNSYATGNVNSLTFTGGLIGNNTGTVENSYCPDGDITGESYTGGLIGQNSGTLTGCYSKNNVSGSVYRVGGLIGYNSGDLSGCSATGNITINSDTEYIGGLVGWNVSAALLNCYSETTIEINAANITYVGGLAGSSSGNITTCNARGTITITADQADYIGGLAGYATATIASSETTDTCSLTITINELASFARIGGLTGETSADIMSSHSTANIDVIITASSSTGTFEGYVGGLAGATSGSITIDSSYTTGAVINTEMYGSTGTDRLYTGGLIGFNSASLTSCSASCTVTTYTNIDYEYAGGLIAFNTGDITNSEASGNISTTEATNTGGLIGYNSGVLTGCEYLSGTIRGNNQIGGLVGNNSAMITDCHTNGTITDTGGVQAGGLIGFNASGGDITYCSSSVDVGGYSQLGGLIGNHQGASNTVKECFATGNVSSTSAFSYAGGLIGFNRGIVSNSYSTGNVEGGDAVGGFIASSSGDITNCYSIGLVTYTTGSYHGGFLGYRDGAAITSCYYNSITSGQSDDDGRGEPRITSQMTYPFETGTTFISWDFTNVWIEDSMLPISNNNYPYLRNNQP